jgi:hypothetical protein
MSEGRCQRSEVGGRRTDWERDEGGRMRGEGEPRKLLVGEGKTRCAGYRNACLSLKEVDFVCAARAI